jgi:hypothetical protein
MLCKIWGFQGGDYEDSEERYVRQLLVTANVAPSSPILVILMMEAIYVPQKRRFLQEPHGVTSQKTPFFDAKHNATM